MNSFFNLNVFAGVVGGIFSGAVCFYLFLNQKKENYEFDGNRTKLVMVVGSGLNLQKGEVAGLCSQVAVECYKKAISVCPSLVAAWEYDGQPKVALKLNPADYDNLLRIQEKSEKLGIVTFLIKHNGNPLVLGIGPGSENKINKVTGHLKLL